MTPAVFLDLATQAAIFLVALALAIGFVRLARGPTLADRVVALDMMTSSVIAFCAILGVRLNLAATLDIAIALALVGFVAVVALARYAQSQSRRDGSDD